jgi:hypothetical protein
MAGLVSRWSDMSAKCVGGMAYAGTYSKVMKPYPAKSENYQGNSSADQAR